MWYEEEWQWLLKSKLMHSRHFDLRATYWSNPLTLNHWRKADWNNELVWYKFISNLIWDIPKSINFLTINSQVSSWVHWNFCGMIVYWLSYSVKSYHAKIHWNNLASEYWYNSMFGLIFIHFWYKQLDE